MRPSSGQYKVFCFRIFFILSLQDLHCLCMICNAETPPPQTPMPSVALESLPQNMNIQWFLAQRPGAFQENERSCSFFHKRPYHRTHTYSNLSQFPKSFYRFPGTDLIFPVRPRHPASLTVQPDFYPFAFWTMPIQNVHATQIIFLTVRTDLISFPGGSSSLLSSFPDLQLDPSFHVQVCV